MIPVAYIDFVESSGAQGPVTKFGGQPWGLRPEDWPPKADGDAPLEFIAQIVLEPSLFPGAAQQLAYVFWNPKQYSKYPGVVLIRQRSELVEAFATGPSLHKTTLGARRLFSREKIQSPCEFTVKLRPAQEPTLADTELMLDEDNPESEKLLAAHDLSPDSLFDTLETAKLGGTPMFIQDSYAKLKTDHLLLQLPHGHFPFDMDLGDAGTFYAFVNQELTAGYGFWQCG